jgi:divinyl chlorophyllide a 8-vinyl-reductase
MTRDHTIPRPMRVLLLGATGTIGRAVAHALAEDGHEVVAVLRPGTAPRDLPASFILRHADVTEPDALARHGLQGERFDAVISCMASRSGAPRDAWAIDHAAHMVVLEAAQAASIPRFTQLSAICVQKPKLEFQRAKLAFEAALMDSGLTYSIVRPTAYFKSLSGQVARLRAGKPFLLFGDGRLTACKPISDSDLARFMVGCLNDPLAENAILPIGGPGPAITPREQGEALFKALGLAPRFAHVPVAMMDAIIAGLRLGGLVSQRARDKAELARIGRYYATESMLVWDAQAGCYDADATPETGQETLQDFYAQLARGDVTIDLGEHAVF